MTREVTVFIVDDDSAARESISAMVRSGGVQAETFASAEDFLDFVDPEMEGCVVSDLRMSGMDGIELAQQLSHRGILLPVIVVSGFGSVATAVRALHEGAITFLEKTGDSQELWNAICHAIDHQSERRKVVQDHANRKKRVAKLTREERQVLELMAAGRTKQEIAQLQNVDVLTVEERRGEVHRKTEIDSLAKLVRLAIQLEQHQEC